MAKLIADCKDKQVLCLKSLSLVLCSLFTTPKNYFNAFFTFVHFVFMQKAEIPHKSKSFNYNNFINAKITT